MGREAYSILFAPCNPFSLFETIYLRSFAKTYGPLFKSHPYVIALFSLHAAGKRPPQAPARPIYCSESWIDTSQCHLGWHRQTPPAQTAMCQALCACGASLTLMRLLVRCNACWRGTMLCAHTLQCFPTVFSIRWETGWLVQGG